jgi:hypothetical protein
MNYPRCFVTISSDLGSIDQHRLNQPTIQSTFIEVDQDMLKDLS